MDTLNSQVKFSALSLKDLLAARDAYHWHLMNKPNVVGTAVGLYLIRRKTVARNAPRTFDNSEVRADSWPCILVLVNDWVLATAFGGRGLDPTHMIPRTLYLPDGRAAPVCVVLVRPGVPELAAPALFRWPDSYIGGGCPILAEVQGEARRASVGCLVTDGHRTYALTNRHVVGEPGSVLSASLRGDITPVGVASDKSLSRVPFEEVFPAFPAQRTFLTLDVGLIDVDVASDWTSRVFGLDGVPGPVADLNELNLGTQLIDQPVEAFGAASGRLKGRIKALFYRYKSMAGYDFVSEFLIAPDDGQAQTCPGDSGTVWHLIEEPADGGQRILRPLAIEWGGQGLTSDAGDRLNFSLATGLSTVCELLDVDIIREGDVGATPFWGQTGHYSIATAAIDAVENPTLRAFLEANVDRISFRPDQLTPDEIRKALASGDFVELADVPDLVWKKLPEAVPGGRDVARNTGPEHPNHYADIDKPANGGGQTLRDLTLQNIANLDVRVWGDWYGANGEPDPSHQGLLPFRVWQMFKVMVAALQPPAGAGPDIPTFLCAAGIISHYIGDACQPLHGSYLSDGYQDQPVSGTKGWRGKGVHSAYEDKMVDANSAVLLAGIGAAADAFNQPIRAIRDGRDAGFATIQLMAYASGVIAPAELCDTYIRLGGGTSKAVIAGLWQAFGVRTSGVMGAGARYLAAVWEAAYEAGGKPALPVQALGYDVLARLYQDPSFAPSMTLDKIAPYL